MKVKKWLYFATQADEANLDGADDAACLPADNLVSISPTANNRVTMYFEAVGNNDPLGAYDNVVLETVVGDAFEVANELVRFINGHPHDDGFVTIADDVVIQDPGDAPLSAVYAHPSITGVNAINITEITTTGNSSYENFPQPMAVGNILPQPANAATLAVNSHYRFGTGTALAYRLPSAAAGRAGDFISVLYTARINNGAAHSYTTTTDLNYYLGSTIRVTPGSSARTGFLDVSIANDNVLTITGLDDGDGGIGTRLMFRNMTGEANGWAVECVVEGEDDNNAATADTNFS